MTLLQPGEEHITEEEDPTIVIDSSFSTIEKTTESVWLGISLSSSSGCLLEHRFGHSLFLIDVFFVLPERETVMTTSGDSAEDLPGTKVAYIVV